MEKSYGGKSGVWLMKKRRNRVSSSSFLTNTSNTTHTNDDCTYNQYECNTSSSTTTTSMTMTESTYTKSSSSLSNYDPINKLHRSKMLKIKGSHYGGMIPRKYVIYSNNSNYVSHYSHSYNQSRCDSYDKEHNIQHYDIHNVKISSPKSSSSFSLLSSNNQHHHLQQQQQRIEILPSPKNQQIGWDSVKCRPIFYFKFQSNHTSYNHYNDETLLLQNDRYDCNDCNNHNDGMKNHDDIIETMIYQQDEEENKNYDDDQNEHSNQTWNEILEQMNHMNAVNNSSLKKNKRTYGGGRKGFTHKPLSVLERLVSPILDHDDNMDKINTKQGRNNIEHNVTGRLGKRRKCSPFKQHKSNIINDVNNNYNMEPRQKFIQQQKDGDDSYKTTTSSFKDVLPSIPMLSRSSDDGFDVPKPNDETLFLTTPVTAHASTTICAGLDSDISASNQAKECIQSTINKRIKSSLNELHFPDDFDDVNDVSKSKGSVINNVSKKRNTIKLLPRLDNNSKQQKKLKKRKIHHDEEWRKENQNPYSIKQISSSTSLSAAKAFFENLDRYELSIV